MCIRKANFKDFATIRKLPVQLTPRPVTRLLPKHFRVLAQEAGVRLLVFEGTHAVSAFMALRFMPAMDSAIRFMVIVHLGLDRHAMRQGIAAEMEEQAAAIALEHRCAALLVQARALPVTAMYFFRERGYELETETLMKKL
jgi:GNAT superfamily N-acetyltransferase